MPPELVKLFEGSPTVVLLLFLAAPFFVLLGVVITGIVQRLRDKGSQGVAEAGVAVSETEAETHQFQAIIDGFEKSLKAVSERAASAESKAEKADTKAGEAEDKANKLSRRVRALEDQQHDAIDHVILLESMIAYPPGPPARPAWMRQLTLRPHAVGLDPDDWVTERKDDTNS